MTATIKLTKKIYHVFLDAEKPLKYTDIKERIGRTDGLKEVLIFLLSVRLIQKEYIKTKKSCTSKYWHYSLFSFASHEQGETK